MRSKRASKSVRTPKKNTEGRKRSLANLREPWKKGAPSPNPGGRPKTKLVSEASRNWLGRLSDGDPNITNAEALIEKIGEQALKGDLASARELADRAEGRARQMVDVSIDERKREWAESQLTRVMEMLKIGREEAVEWMRTNTPTAAQWVN